MKKVLSFAIALFCFTVMASAQFLTSQGSSTGSSLNSASVSAWQGVRASYGMGTLSLSEDSSSSDVEDFTSYTISYVKSNPASVDYPIFLEYAPEFDYMSKSSTETYYDEKIKTQIQMISVSLPVNVVYQFPMSNITLLPYVGARVQGNLSAKTIVSYDGEKETEDAFKMEDSPYKRLLLGYQAGVGALYNDIYFGVSYNGMLTPYAKQDEYKMTYKQIRFTIGYNF